MYREHQGKKPIKTDGCKLMLMLSKLLASVDMIEFCTTEAYSNLDQTKVKCSAYKHSRVEKLYVMEWMRPKRFRNFKNT
jgi:hypothetical protein